MPIRTILARLKSAGSGRFGRVVDLWSDSSSLLAGKSRVEMIRSYRGWVYACAKKNAEAVASAEPILYVHRPEKSAPKYQVRTPAGRALVNKTTFEAVAANPNLAPRIRKGWQIEEVSRHPFLELFDRVNPFRTLWDLLFETCLYQELTGDCYWYLIPSRIPSRVEGGRALPAEIWTLQSDKVRIIPGKDSESFISGYEWRSGARTTRFDPSEIVHFRYPNPESQYYGLSPLEAAAYPVDIEFAKKRYIHNFFKNFAVPPVVFTLPYDIKTGKGPKWSRKEWEAYRKAFMESHSGPGNAGKMALMQGGLTISNVGFSPREFFHLVNNRPTIEELAAIFGIPLFKLTGEGADRLNAEKADYSYMKDTITPKLKQIAAKVTEQILPLYGDGLFLEFASVVPDDKQFQLEEQRALINSAITVNEIRSDRGLPSIEGGDQLYVDSTKVPLGYIPPAPIEDQDEGKTAPDPAVKSAAGHGSEMGKAAPVQSAIAARAEAGINLWLTRLLRRFVNEVADRMEEPGTPEHWLEPAKKYRDEMVAGADRVIKIYSESGQKSMDEVWAAYSRRERKLLSDITTAFSLESPEAIEYIKLLREGFSVFWDRDRVHMDALRLRLAQGIQNGLPVEDLASIVAREMGFVPTVRVAEDGASWDIRYDPRDNYRATRIARTETIRASNYGAMEGWRQTGIVAGKEWVAADDCCEFCEPLNGMQWNLEQEMFRQGESAYDAEGNAMELNYSDIDAPPLHPNCRCAIAPIIFFE